MLPSKWALATRPKNNTPSSVQRNLALALYTCIGGLRAKPPSQMFLAQDLALHLLCQHCIDMHSLCQHGVDLHAPALIRRPRVLSVVALEVTAANDPPPYKQCASKYE